MSIDDRGLYVSDGDDLLNASPMWGAPEIGAVSDTVDLGLKIILRITSCNMAWYLFLFGDEEGE